MQKPHILLHTHDLQYEANKIVLFQWSVVIVFCLQLLITTYML